MRHPGHLLHHWTAVLVDARLAVLVTRLALEHARPAQLLAGSNVLALQHRDQLIAPDHPAAVHAELGQRVVGAEPQR